MDHQRSRYCAMHVDLGGVGIGKSGIPSKKRSGVTNRSSLSTVKSLEKELNHILKYDEEFSNIGFDEDDVLIYNENSNRMVSGNEIGLGVVPLKSEPVTARAVKTEETSAPSSGTSN
ncbi:hypothetical protein M0R45_026591 [Rubus argutus]|uniref:Uncharacterized protein n=1 Tax=Rubus argutus TaxID=59490 RepID=A0AAW1WXK9_RUBAR